jgi:hypothetical protein
MKGISKQIELYTKQEILLPPPPLKEKTKEEIEKEIEIDLLKLRHKIYQPNSSYRAKKDNFLLQREKSKEFDLVKERRSGYLRSSKAITIPAKAEDYYNEMEYQVHDNMMDIILRFSFDLIRNPHHNPSNKSYLFSKSSFILNEKITHYKKLKKKSILIFFYS